MTKINFYTNKTDFTATQILESMNIPTNYYSPPIEEVAQIIRISSATDEEFNKKMNFIIIGRNFYNRLPEDSKKKFIELPIDR